MLENMNKIGLGSLFRAVRIFEKLQMNSNQYRYEKAVKWCLYDNSIMYTRVYLGREMAVFWPECSTRRGEQARAEDDILTGGRKRPRVLGVTPYFLSYMYHDSALSKTYKTGPNLTFF